MVNYNKQCFLFLKTNNLITKWQLMLIFCRLPVPWLIFAIIYREPVEVNSSGMVCSITILFMMLIFVIMSIAMFRWRMNRVIFSKNHKYLVLIISCFAGSRIYDVSSILCVCGSITNVRIQIHQLSSVKW